MICIPCILFRCQKFTFPKTGHEIFSFFEDFFENQGFSKVLLLTVFS